MYGNRFERRIDEKLNAIMEKLGLDGSKITGQLPAPEATKPTQAEKQALANAPATPAATHPASGPAPAVDPVTNAPVTPATDTTAVYPAPDPVTNAPSTVPVVVEPEPAQRTQQVQAQPEPKATTKS